MMLVTLQEARDHLLMDTSDMDAWIMTTVEAVSDAVLAWLKDSWRAYEVETDSNGDDVLDSNGDPVPLLDSNGEPVVKRRVKQAVLVETALQFRFREGAEAAYQVPAHWGHGHALGYGATALLASVRKATAK